MKKMQDAGAFEQPGSEDLQMFVAQLNRVYCVKSHLVERLPDTSNQLISGKLHLLIDETVRLKEDEIKLMDDFYFSLGLAHDFNNCKELVNFLEDNYSSYRASLVYDEISFLTLLSYLYHIETIEKVSTTIMLLLSERLDIPAANELFNHVLNAADRTLIHELEGRFIRI